MKRPVFLVSIVLILTFAGKTVSSADVLDSISATIRSSDANSLAGFFDASIDVTILDKESVYSKAQAQMVVRDFFLKYPVSSFNLVHRGSSSEGSQYGIGTMVSGSQSFRVYFLVRMKAGQNLIKELRFEKQ